MGILVTGIMCKNWCLSTRRPQINGLRNEIPRKISGHTRENPAMNGENYIS